MEDVSRAASQTQLHRHTGTCRKGKVGLIRCRVSRPHPIVQETSVVQIESVKIDKGKQGYVVLDKFKDLPINSTAARNLNQMPIPTRDNSLMMWEIMRRDIIALTDQKSLKNENTIHNRIPPLSEKMMADLAALSTEDYDRLNRLLVQRNGIVVEYNPTIISLLTCNTNVGILGSDAQANATARYVLKYVTKDPTQLQESLSLLYHARKNIEDHPSTADDTGSIVRNGMHFVERYTNQSSSTCEISAPAAAAAILGMPSEKMTASPFW